MKSSNEPIIYLIDDDLMIRRALGRVLKSVGLTAEMFASAEDFLDAPHRQTDACLLLDVRLPERGGLELQEELKTSGSSLPIVFITAHWSASKRDAAIAAGAVAFLAKPVDEKALFGAIDTALKISGT